MTGQNTEYLQTQWAHVKTYEPMLTMLAKPCPSGVFAVTQEPFQTHKQQSGAIEPPLKLLYKAHGLQEHQRTMKKVKTKR